ncbi:hypothetical protein AWC38_SpisGene23797, partial [Stylophora pistillata]
MFVVTSSSPPERLINFFQKMTTREFLGGDLKTKILIICSFVVVLLQTLVCLFCETDILSTRLMVIKAHKGQAIKDPLKCIVLHPLTTSQQPVGISLAAQLLLSGADKNMFTEGDREQETDKLLREVLVNATSLLFVLMCAVHQ